jgi:hypothetical protein
VTALRAFAVGIVVLNLVRTALAECPADCVGGGKVAATDCLVEFAGIPTSDEGCTDGNPSCDMDGVVNGVCTFPVSVCINVAGDPRCTVHGLSGPPVVRPARSAVGQELSRALAALDPAQPGCTTPGLGVPLTATLKGVSQAVARLSIIANAGSKRDRNKLRLTCRPSPVAPSLADVVGPIFEARCALPACHAGTPGSVGPVLSGPDPHAALVGVPAMNVPSLMLVLPGSVAQSYLARKILGKRISDRTPRMPQGCPGGAAPGGCLTDAEIAAIVAWIQTGAPDN